MLSLRSKKSNIYTFTIHTSSILMIGGTMDIYKIRHQDITQILNTRISIGKRKKGKAIPVTGRGGP
jgi:hypothetical protein